MRFRQKRVPFALSIETANTRLISPPVIELPTVSCPPCFTGPAFFHIGDYCAMVIDQRQVGSHLWHLPAAPPDWA
jgi:hypothetical protein